MIWKQLSRRRYRVDKAWRFWSSLGSWTVPIGFETDLASVPRGFRWLFPRDGNYALAAVAHDWLYVNRPRITYYRAIDPVTPGRPRTIKGERDMQRQDADRIMLELMKKHGVSSWRRAVIYSAVRAGGWWVWNRRKNVRPS